MPKKDWTADPAVVVLHNVDPAWAADDIATVLDTVAELVSALRNSGHQVLEAPVHSPDLAAALAPYKPDAHIVLNWCEELPGMPHSDAYVAAHLDRRGYTYTGSTPAVLALSWDKAAVKARLVQKALPTPDCRLFTTDAVEGWERFPAIVKPAFEHCSVGLDSDAVVLDRRALAQRVAYVCRTFAQPALVEDFIDGREFHVTLYGNGHIAMLPPAEMDFSNFSDVRDRLCTYDSKFTPGSRHYEGVTVQVPAVLDAAQSALLHQTATAAYRCLGCRDFARLDLRLRDGRFYILDINPNPDISPDTSLAYAAEAAGLTYGAFISRLVRLAGVRHPGLPLGSGHNHPPGER